MSLTDPKDADDDRDGKATEIYYLTFFAHIANIICQVLKHYLSPWWHLEKKILTIIVLMFQLYMINTICGEWIFTDNLTDYSQFEES